MSRALIVVALVFFILEIVNGYLLPPRLALAEHEQHLSKRNLSTFLDDIPPACTVQCDVVRGAAHSCAYMDCVCTEDNSNALVKCVNCVVALTPDNPGVVEKHQLVLDEWKNSYCKQFWTPAMKVGLPPSASSSPSPTPTPRPNSANSISVGFWVMVVLSTLDVSLLFLL